MPKKEPKERMRRDAEKLREREAAADKDVDERLDEAAHTLDELKERSGKAEASYRAKTAEDRKAAAADVEKKLGKRD
jgi:hypothetical protein